MHTLSSVQAGTRLLAAAMRDPAPIVNLSTFWDFMKIIEAAASRLLNAEKANPLYLEHVACYDRIYQLRTDMTPADSDHMQLGDRLIEAMAAYADQAVDLLPLLLEHEDDPAQGVSLLQECEGVLATLVEEIHEVPSGPAVQLALAAFKQCPEREQAEALYDQALDLYDQQQYEACLVLLDQAIHLDRGNADFYYARGNTRHKQKDFRGAAADYHWALRRAPYHVSAFNNLGNTYEVLEQYEKSLFQYQHALRIEPENATLHYNLAGAYHALNRLPEALAALNTAIELDPAFAGCYLNRANTLSRLGKHEEALADYRQALALEPDDSNIAWTVTWAQFGHKGLDDAQVRELERISQLDPSHYTAFCCLAVAAYQHADLQAALLHLEQAVALAPKDWDPHFWIGMIAAMTGEPEVARQAIERSLELGLPPLLLAPLSWLKGARTDFFERYADKLLQRFEVTKPE